jgi:eukaryotic-like serine/threonine-protein kinase
LSSVPGRFHLNTKTCPRCGTNLTEDAPHGLCPSCLIQAGLAGETGHEAFDPSARSEPSPTERALDSPTVPKVGSEARQPAITAILSSPDDQATIGPNGAETDGTARGVIPYFGDYQLLGEIARGGMGVVYRARQVSLNRTVALKLILSSQLATDTDVKRFHGEAEAAANLDHPNIVPIYEVGAYHGQHYFSMKLIDGESLSHQIDELIKKPRNAAKLLFTVARAVHRAHQRGIIHRDLKPSNILIDRDGQPHVTDFGLAKRVEADSDSRLTQSGAIMGTPSYMPPEQAAGRIRQLTTAVDVYSLGAILYELLTGRPPFQAESVMDTLRQVLDQEPRRPRLVNPHADRDLETIAMKCLEKDPARRYGSAEALAEDLERWLNHEPIRARPASPPERLAKWVKRRPAIAALGLTAVVLATSGVTGVLFQWQRSVTARNEAIRSEAMARAAEAGARAARAEAMAAQAEASKNRELAALQAQYRYFNLIRIADQYLRASNVQQAEQFLEACPVGLRAWEWGHLKLLCHPEQRSFAGEDVAYSPDGAFLAIDDSPIPTVSLLDTKTWTTARVFQVPGSRVACFNFSPDGKLLAAAGHEKTIKVWSAADGQELATLKGHTGDLVLDLAFSPDGKLLASAGARFNQVQGGLMADEVRIWDIAQAKTVRAIPDAGHSVVFSPDGKHLATCTEQPVQIMGRTGIVGGALHVLDAETGAVVWTAPVDQWSERELQYSPDGKRLASSNGRSGEVRIRDAASGKLLQTLRGHKDAVSCLAFSADGKRLATGGADTAVKTWDLASGRELTAIHGHGGTVTSVSFSRDGKNLASADAKRSIRIWDANAEPGTHTPAGAESGSFVAVPGHNGKLLAVLRPRLFSVNLAVLEAETGRQVHSLRSFVAFQGFNNDIKLAFSPDGRLLASTDGKNLAQLWDLTTGRERTALKRHLQQVTALAFSRDGQTLATADASKTIKIWEAASGRELKSLQSEFTPLALAHSPDGTKLAVAGRGPVRHEKQNETTQQAIVSGKGAVWDLAAGRVLYALPDHGMQTVAVSFSPDGTRLATASWDSTARIIDASDGHELHRLGGHTSYVYGVAFSPDSRRLATCGTTIKLWDVSTAQEVIELSDGYAATQITFSPNGQEITSSNEGRVKLWESNPDRGQPASAGR